MIRDYQGLRFPCDAHSPVEAPPLAVEFPKCLEVDRSSGGISAVLGALRALWWKAPGPTLHFRATGHREESGRKETWGRWTMGCLQQLTASCWSFSMTVLKVFPGPRDVGDQSMVDGGWVGYFNG